MCKHIRPGVFSQGPQTIGGMQWAAREQAEKIVEKRLSVLHMFSVVQKSIHENMYVHYCLCCCLLYQSQHQK